MSDHIEEMSERLGAAAGRWRSPGRREPALDDDTLAVAEPTVAGRAEDAVSLLPHLEDTTVNGKRRRFGQSAILLAGQKHRLITHPGHPARISPRNGSGGTSGRDEVPSSKDSLRSSGSYRAGRTFRCGSQTGERSSAPRPAATRPDMSQRQSVLRRRGKTTLAWFDFIGDSVGNYGDHFRLETSNIRYVSSGSNRGSRA